MLFNNLVFSPPSVDGVFDAPIVFGEYKLFFKTPARVFSLIFWDSYG
jgi:hypothetical protein